MTLDASPWVRHWVEEIETPQGARVNDFHMVELRDFAIVAAITPDDTFVTGRAYRHGAGRICRILPAGYTEDGETPLEAAQRELLEETGYVAQGWRELGVFAVDGNRGCGRMHAFAASNAALTQAQHLDATEEIEVCLLSRTEALLALSHGEFATLAGAAALSLAFCLVADDLDGDGSIHG